MSEFTEFNFDRAILFSARLWLFSKDIDFVIGIKVDMSVFLVDVGRGTPHV